MKTKHLNQEQVLMDAFNFNLRDLHANREGRIVKAHGKRVMQREQIRWMPPLALLASSAVCSFFPLFIMLANEEYTLLMSVLPFVVSISILVIGAALAQWLPIARDIDAAQVESIQGIIVVDINPG